MGNRARVDTRTTDWVAAGEIRPDYAVDTGDADTGVFLKLLRRPDDGGGCWHWLIRFAPPAGYRAGAEAIRGWSRDRISSATTISTMPAASQAPSTATG